MASMNNTDLLQHFQKASALHQQGELEQAGALCESILREIPNHVPTLQLQGLVLFAENKIGDLERCVKRIRKLSPKNPNVFYLLGLVYLGRKEYEQAIKQFKKALQHAPDFHQAWKQLGVAYHGNHDEKKAIEAYSQCEKIAPHDADNIVKKGDAFALLEEYVLALKTYKKAAQVDHNCARAFQNMSKIYFLQSKFHLALSCIQEALSINPDLPDAYNEMACCHLDLGNLSASLQCLQKALEIDPEGENANSNRLFIGNYTEEVTPEEHFQQHKHWGEQYVKRFSTRQHQKKTLLPEKTLRIGYISPDFREHSVSYFSRHLLQKELYTTLEIYAYSTVKKADHITTEFSALPHQWRDLLGWDHEKILSTLHKDHIDILIDLSGHTAGHRLAVFAQQAAPIQVTYLGYPNTTGLPTMHYRLTDSLADLPSQDSLYTETLFRLPSGFLCYSPSPKTPPVSALPSATTKTVTFGSFNTIRKMTPKVLHLWAEILRRVPDSRLVLKARCFREEESRQSYLKRFSDYGIDEQRLTLLERTPTSQEHLDIYNQVDIALDSFPYNGTTTTCEALFMGVPVVTLAGERHASRVGFSILAHLGKKQWIASTEEEYREIAVALAQNPDLLQQERQNLRQHMLSSSLCDKNLHAQELEKAYREMWKQFCYESRST